MRVDCFTECNIDSCDMTLTAIRKFASVLIYALTERGMTTVSVLGCINVNFTYMTYVIVGRYHHGLTVQIRMPSQISWSFGWNSYL